MVHADYRNEGPSMNDFFQNVQDVAIAGLYNNVHYAILKALQKVQTFTVVQVMACSNEGGLSPVGTVDILPLVNQVDAAGNSVPHITIPEIPYCRVQGGQNAIILDPAVGDLGVVAFASRDISKVLASKTQSPPGSWRTHNFADGIYLFSILGGIPTQFVQFNADGITLTSPVKVIIKAPAVNLTS